MTDQEKLTHLVKLAKRLDPYRLQELVNVAEYLEDEVINVYVAAWRGQGASRSIQGSQPGPGSTETTP